VAVYWKIILKYILKKDYKQKPWINLAHFFSITVNPNLRVSQQSRVSPHASTQTDAMLNADNKHCAFKGLKCRDATEIKIAIPAAFTSVIPANFPALKSFTSFHLPSALCLPSCYTFRDYCKSPDGKTCYVKPAERTGVSQQCNA
jgi:hypothetical protein